MKLCSQSPGPVDLGISNVTVIAMLLLVLLVTLPAQVLSADDHAVREILVPSIQAQLEPYVFGDPYWRVPTVARKFTDATSNVATQLLEGKGFSSIEDTVFAYRPNAVEWSLRLYETGGCRVAYAGVYLACFSKRQKRSSTEFRVEDWRHNPRPVAVVPKGQNTNPEEIAFRTWPSESELRGDTATDLSWCLGPASDPETSREELGVLKTFSISSKLPTRDSYLERTVEDISSVEGDSAVALSKLRRVYESVMDKEGSNRDGRIRYMQKDVTLGDPFTNNSITDYNSTIADQEPALFGKALRLAIDTGQDRLFKSGGSSDLHLRGRIAPEEPGRSSGAEFVLAISSAIAGTALEDFLLMRLLEGRTIKHEKYSPTSKALLLVVLLTLVSFDLLPLIFLVVEERKIRGWFAQGAGAFLLSTHATGNYDLGIRHHPEGHGILLAIETWRVTSSEDFRGPLITTALVTAIGLHMCVFGHRAYVLLADELRRRKLGVVARRANQINTEGLTI